MPSHSSARSRRSNRKSSIPRMLRRNKKIQPPPQAPAELDAILGYGASSSFPLFTKGVASRIKKLFARKF